MSVKIPNKIKEKLSGMAWDIHEKLRASGLNVWGVVVSGEDNVEVYFYDGEEDRLKVEDGVKKLKKEVGNE